MFSKRINRSMNGQHPPPHTHLHAFISLMRRVRLWGTLACPETEPHGGGGRNPPPRPEPHPRQLQASQQLWAEVTQSASRTTLRWPTRHTTLPRLLSAAPGFRAHSREMQTGRCQLPPPSAGSGNPKSSLGFSVMTIVRTKMRNCWALSN